MRVIERLSRSTVMFVFLWCALSAHAAAGTRLGLPEEPGRTREFRYQMRGEVRILLFWLGRDNVGGGKISIASGSEIDRQWKEIEVCFGSNPERVPGNVNRWGYGRERAEWKAAAAEISRTIFEGFMRPSDEESISQVIDDSGNQKSNTSYRYHAIRSVVASDVASSEIRHFVEDEEFDYRHPETLWAKYQEHIASAPPDRKNRLLNEPLVYASPYGLLTAVSHLIERVSSEFAEKPNDWLSFKSSITYIYNAKPYRLEVRKTKYRKALQLSTKTASGATFRVSDVAEVQFQIENLTKDRRHRFTLCFPLRGTLRGIPVRIVHQPRWWLRLKLDLDLAGLSETSRVWLRTKGRAIPPPL